MSRGDAHETTPRPGTPRSAWQLVRRGTKAHRAITDRARRGFHPGWTTNTGGEAAKVANALRDAHALVIMRFVPTVLGEQLRRLVDVAGVPWVACTGHGRASMTRAIDHAVRVALHAVTQMPQS